MTPRQLTVGSKVTTEPFTMEPVASPLVSDTVCHNRWTEFSQCSISVCLSTSKVRRRRCNIIDVWTSLYSCRWLYEDTTECHQRRNERRHHVGQQSRVCKPYTPFTLYDRWQTVCRNCLCNSCTVWILHLTGTSAVAFTSCNCCTYSWTNCCT